MTCQQLIGDLKHVERYRNNFSRVEVRFFSVVEIPTKHSVYMIKIINEMLLLISESKLSMKKNNTKSFISRWLESN